MSQEDKPAVSKKPKAAETQLDTSGEKIHDAALRDETPDRKLLKEAVKEAMRDEFEVVVGPRTELLFKIPADSGQNYLVKHLDTTDLMRSGLIEELDYFTRSLFPSEFDEAGNPVDKTAEKAEKGIWDLLKNPEKRYRFLDMTNRLMVVSSRKPEIVNDGVALRKNNQGEMEDVFGYEVKDIQKQIEIFGKPVPVLQPGQIYAGYIPFTDRMQFLTELNKPVRMIEPFREGSDDVLEDLEPSESIELQAEPAL